MFLFGEGDGDGDNFNECRLGILMIFIKAVSECKLYIDENIFSIVFLM